MQIANDQSCSWIQDLEPRNNIRSLNSNETCDFIIIGAGYTGLSAARTLGKANPNSRIIIVDAQLAGEGASGRNSGYLVDTTLNEGFVSTKDLSIYENKTKLYQQGIKTVKKFVEEYQVDCDWNECGKYYASSNLDDKNILENFSKVLNSQNIPHKILNSDELKKALGTSFYKIGLYTNSGVLIHPGKLVRAMVNNLPANVNLYENSQLLNWKKSNGRIICKFEKGEIVSNKIIFCANGFLPSLGIKQRYSFPISLTASTTRVLTSEEFNLMGNPKEWGVLSVRPMGATIRMTKDKRLSIRNTAEIKNPYESNTNNLINKKKLHLLGLKKRFPFLPDDIIEYSWTGIACRSANGTQIFEQLDSNIFAAGCFNGAGIGLGTLFGEQIALKALGQQTKEIDLINLKPDPKWLPPEPFLSLGIKTRLIFERIKAKSEI